jgi:hypothetical protein
LCEVMMTLSLFLTPCECRARFLSLALHGAADRLALVDRAWESDLEGLVLDYRFEKCRLGSCSFLWKTLSIFPYHQLPNPPREEEGAVKRKESGGEIDEDALVFPREVKLRWCVVCSCPMGSLLVFVFPLADVTEPVKGERSRFLGGSTLQIDAKVDDLPAGSLLPLEPSIFPPKYLPASFGAEKARGACKGPVKGRN